VVPEKAIEMAAEKFFSCNLENSSTGLQGLKTTPRMR